MVPRTLQSCPFDWADPDIDAIPDRDVKDPPIPAHQPVPSADREPVILLPLAPE
jgi:hypothetical protein